MAVAKTKPKSDPKNDNDAEKYKQWKHNFFFC